MYICHIIVQLMASFSTKHKTCFFPALAVLVFMSAGFLCAAQDGERGYAIVDVSCAFLRAEADYESPLETQEFMGAVVEVVGHDGYWVKVRTSQPYTAWCNEKCLAFTDSLGVKEWNESERYMVTAPFSRIYSRPDRSSSPVTDLCRGDIVQACCGGKGNRPVVSGKWAEVSVPGGRTGWTLRADILDYGRWRESLRSRSEDDVRKSVVREAGEWMGVPYLWGGMSPKGFDCSGLVRYVYYMNGMLLPRNASQQAECGVAVPVFKTVVEAVGAEKPECGSGSFCPDALLPGDLLFFGTAAEGGRPARITHVGIYAGGGRMIHSSQLVRRNSLCPQDADCYENAGRLICARRIIGCTSGNPAEL